MKNSTFIINGPATSGKDTFVDIVNEILSDYDIDSHKISSVEMVKSAALLLGWDNVKDIKGREFLHKLKMLSSDYYEGSFNFMIRRRTETNSNTPMFFMIREPEEIEKFKVATNAITILITRDNIESYDNYADTNTHKYDYDIVIENNGTKKDLYDIATNFVLGYIFYERIYI